MARKLFVTILILSLSVLLSSASRSWAQIEVGNYTITGEAEISGLPSHRNGSTAKFEEYRDIPETVIVPQLQLMIGGKKQDFYLEFDTTKPGRDDQNYRLRFGRYGLLDIEFEWDQIPHIFNVDNARTPYVANNGTFTLANRPAAATNAAFRAWAESEARPIDLKLYNGVAKFKLRYTPTPGWSFTGSYWSNNNSGKRALGIINGGSPGGNVSELAEPIDYQSHNIELGGEYAGNGWSLGLKYNASLFHNNVSTLVWDNPNRAVGAGACLDQAAYNAAGSTGPCRGRYDLYPSNQAHTFTLMGTAKLPLKTHFLGTVSYGWRLQDDSFLPMTINSNIATVPPVPRSSLDGDVRPLMVNATLVNNSIDRVNLKAFYRYYDLENKSKKVFFEEGLIINDQGSAADTGVRSFPFAYSKQNLGFDASYNFARWLTAKFGYQWEKMHRERREVLNANEHSFGPTFDINPTSWSLIRLGYKRFIRDAHDYDAGRQVVIDTEDTPEEIRNERNPFLRKFDEAARNRDKFSFYTQVTPLQTLTLFGGFDFNNDRFPRTVLGLKKDIDLVPSVGFLYAPLEWLSLFGDYNWERFDWKMKAMERSSPATGGELQNPVSDPGRVWTSRGQDQIHTMNFGTDIKLIKNLLGLRLQYGFSEGTTQVHSSGNTVGTPATNYPTIRNAWHEFLARLEYDFHKNVGLRLGYYYNSYSSRDYGVDIMKVWMGDVDTGTGQQRSLYLGDRLKGNYNAHVGTIGLKFKF